MRSHVSFSRPLFHQVLAVPDWASKTKRSENPDMKHLLAGQPV